MKKLLYVLLGAASVILYKSLSTTTESETGAMPRSTPKSMNHETAADEVAGPVGEV